MSRLADILQRADEEAARHARLRDDRRVKAVMAYLGRKGLLLSNHDFGRAPRSLTAAQCNFAAENFEPRIYAVLPAILLHFEKGVLDPERLPSEIRRAADAIRKGEKIDVSIHGIAFSEMERWARSPIADKRVRPIGEKKIVKTFRLSPPAVEKLQSLAATSGVSLTEALEAAISKAG